MNKIDFQNELDQIILLRMAVARSGEMDQLKWWNSAGLLGSNGELVMPRGFPKTHVFARAQAVFAIAANRSDEVFNPLDSFTLWRLPVELEDQIADRWSDLLNNTSQAEWREKLLRIDHEISNTGELLRSLSALGLISDETAAYVSKLRRAVDLRSVHIRQPGRSRMDSIEILAAAFSCGEPGKLAVPFIRCEDFPS